MSFDNKRSKVKSFKSKRSGKKIVLKELIRKRDQLLEELKIINSRINSFIEIKPIEKVRF